MTRLKFLFDKYKYLSIIYSSKIGNYERLGLGKEDIIQEMNVRIYATIISFGKRWKEYRENGGYKPIPLQYSIKCALNRQLIDYYRKMNTNKYSFLSCKDTIDTRSQFDVALYSDNTSIFEPAKGVSVINGIDLLDNIECVQRRKCYCLYMSGYSIKELNLMFSFDVKKFISGQTFYLRNNKKEELIDSLEKNREYKVTEYATEYEY